MNDTVLGALIGGGLILLGTYLNLQHKGKLELKKLTLSELREKRLLIGKIKKELIHNWSNENMEGNEYVINSEYNSISDFLILNSHFFIDSERIENFQKEIDNIENDNGYTESLEILFSQVDLINEFKKFINLESKKTSKHINKLTGIE